MDLAVADRCDHDEAWEVIAKTYIYDAEITKMPISRFQVRIDGTKFGILKFSKIEEKTFQIFTLRTSMPNFKVLG